MPIQPVSGEIKAQPLNTNFSYLESLALQANGGPIDEVSSVSALNSKYPNGANGVVLVGGIIYLWNGSAWFTNGTVYQATALANESVTTPKIASSAVTPDRTNFVTSDVNIANPSSVKNGYRYAVSNGLITAIADSNYNSILVPVLPSYWYSINMSDYSSAFSHAVNTDMSQASLLNNLERDSASVFKTTSTTRFIALSVSSTIDLSKLVMMQKREDILSLTVAEWPYNKSKNIAIPDLIVAGEPAENLKTPAYQNVVSKKTEILKNPSFTIFSGGTITDNTWSGSGQYQGMYTQFFESNFEETMIDIDVAISGLTSVDVMLRYRDSNNTSKYIKLIEKTSSFKETLFFDASNLAIYNDAKDFAILVRNTGTHEGSFTINELLVYIDELSRLSFYGDNLKDTLLNLDAELQNIKPSEDVFLKSPNGTRYKLSVSDEGVLSVKSTEYAKINVSGNSLVNGINQGSHGTKNFGMCASDSKHDFNYLVQQAILAKNADATFTQTQISGIEMATNQAEYEAYRDSIANSYTADTDLIILQIGDNTTAYIDNFKVVFPQFLTWLKSRCQLAEIVIVGTWFSKSVAYPVVKQCASDAGLKFVDISALNTTENQSTIGAIITYDDGTTTVASDSWVRHPGDSGHQLIAEKIIQAI